MNLHRNTARCLVTGIATIATIAPMVWAAEPSPRSIDPPTPPGASFPALAAEGSTTITLEHEILLTWLEPAASGSRLRFSRFTGKSWSPPITLAEPVASGDPADGPALAVIETHGVRRTLLARTGDVVARSGDAGRAWERLPAPSLTYASFAGGEEGAYAFWLRPGPEGSATLLGTRVLAGETVLDPQVASATETSAAMTWDGPIVVYRDRDDQDSHSLAVVRRQDGHWTESRKIYSESGGGLISAPRVAALERRVAVAWMAEPASGPRLRIAFSVDAGRSFAPPVDLAAAPPGASTTGPAAVTFDDEGNALVLWVIARGAESSTVQVTRVAADGRCGDWLQLGEGPVSPRGSFPQLVRAGSRLAVSWIEGDPGRVRVVSVPLAAIPELGSHRPALAVTAAAADHPAGRGRVGDFLPAFESTALDGTKVTPATLAGRPVLLNLWATWCLPCLGEMPELAKLQKRYSGEGLMVVGLSVDTADAAGRVRAMVAEREIPFAVWLDPAMALYRSLRVRTLPTTLVVDRAGKILLRRDRAITGEDAEIEEALGRAVLPLDRASSPTPY